MFVGPHFAGRRLFLPERGGWYHSVQRLDLQFAHFQPDLDGLAAQGLGDVFQDLVVPGDGDQLGEDRPMRYTTVEKKGFFSKLFGA